MNLDVFPSNWKWTTLNEVKANEKGAIVTGPFGSNIGSKYFVETGIPVIRGSNISTEVVELIEDDFVFVTEEKADELASCTAIKDDIIFTAAGSLGQVGKIPANSRYEKWLW